MCLWAKCSLSIHSNFCLACEQNVVCWFILIFAWPPCKLLCLQRIGMGQSFPWLLDSALCVGVIFHGICDSKPEFNPLLFPFPIIPGFQEVRRSHIYLLAGLYSYLSGLALAPYRVFYAMAAIGLISFTFKIIERRSREKGEAYVSSRKHSHRHWKILPLKARCILKFWCC